MRIHDLLLERQRQRFVGRERELALLHGLMDGPEQDWHLLHIHGPGGSGKTTLLRLFAERAGWRRCLVVDGSAGLTAPHDLMVRLQQELVRRDAWPGVPSDPPLPEYVAEAVNGYAEQCGGLLLLFDAFEKWGMVEGWLREEWLPTLHPQVKLCTAGRFPLEGEWLGGGWNLLVRNLPLPPLSLDEVVAYARACGIDDLTVIDSLRRLTGGNPLALAMASDIIRLHGNGDFLTDVQQHQVIRVLMAEMQEDIRDSDLHSYLEAATVVRRFDQELLQAIIQEPVPVERFRALCALPFINQHDQLWMLHDSVRTWALSDLKARRPSDHEHYRSRARGAIGDRMAADEGHATDWLFDQLYLSENEFLRGLWFQGREECHVKPCQAQDLGAIESLYQAYLHHQTGSPPGDVHFEGLIRPLWQVAPEAFWGLWDDDRLIAFCVVIPINDKTLPLLRQNPITAVVAQRYQPGAPQYLLGPAGFDPSHGDGIDGALAPALLRVMPRKALIYNQLSFSKWYPYMELMGFERIPWADAVTLGGTLYRGYQIDLRHQDHAAKVEGLILAIAAQSPETPAPQRPPLKEVAEWLRPVLRHFDHLHLQPHLVLPFQYLFGVQPQISADAMANELQRRIRDAVDRLTNGTEGERLTGQILRHAYTQKIGSHETAAERLNLSVPTYYRHLRLAVHRLAQELAE